MPDPTDSYLCVLPNDVYCLETAPSHMQPTVPSALPSESYQHSSNSPYGGRYAAPAPNIFLQSQTPSQVLRFIGFI
jgi:hypothetical protein